MARAAAVLGSPGMQRRPPGFRRPARSLLSGWTCWLLGLFAVVGLLFFVVLHRHHDPFRRPIEDLSSTSKEVPRGSLNLTQELLTSTSFARQLVDQMTLAKAYVVIAKEHGNLELAWKFSSHIRNCQRLLSKASIRGTPINLEEAHPIVTSLSELIYKAQDLHYDIGTTIKTLKNHVHALKERLTAATTQSVAFGKMAAEAIPKYLHCLNIKLTVDWYEDPTLEKVAVEERNSPRLVDKHLYHFCVFSDNVLATSVVVNSTVSNVDHPQQLVFHVVTNSNTYLAMTTWFIRNDFKGCTVEVQNIEELSWLNSSYSPLVKQVLDSKIKRNWNEELIPKIEPLLIHLRFYVPELYPSLEKIVFLDDDVVVQKDLTPLFSLDLHGNVNGAVETCLEAFHRMYRYLNFSNPVISSKFDPQACAWAFGVNVFDLVAWKKVDITRRYHYWQEQNAEQKLWIAGILPPGLLAFYGTIEPLDRRWHVLGLGFDEEIDGRLIDSAAVVHFSGHMKPWLKLSVDRYKHLWERYINDRHPFVRQCIIH